MKCLCLGASKVFFRLEVAKSFVKVLFRSLNFKNLGCFFELDSMENSTNFDRAVPFVPFTWELWIIEIGCSSILSIISTYLLVAFLYHQTSVKKTNKIGFFQKNLEEKFKIMSTYATTLSGVCVLIRHLDTTVLFTFEGIILFSNLTVQQTAVAEVACKVLPRVANLSLICAGVLMNLFLWLRQSIFYVHPSLKIIKNKYLKFLSFSTLAIYSLFGIVVAVLYFVKVYNQFSKTRGCPARENDGGSSYLKIVISWTVTSILMQIILLGLFIYPILKRTSIQRHQNDAHNSNRLLKRIKKAVILATVCLSSDVIVLTVYISILLNESRDTGFPYSINMAVNFLVAISWFDYWKKLLWPWNSKCCVY